MITYKCTLDELFDLVGKIAFHCSKGAIQRIKTPPFINHCEVGHRLGEIVEVGGTNRIYYLTSDGDRKYVSLSGLGYICSTEHEADILEQLAEGYKNKINHAVLELTNELDSAVEELLQKTT